MNEDRKELIYRWTLALGLEPQEKIESEDDLQKVEVLNRLYNEDQQQSLQRSMPKLTKWNQQLIDQFPKGIAELVQQDAIHKYGLQKLLLDERYLETVEPNINLLSNLLSLKKHFKSNTLKGLKRLIERMAEDLEAEIEANVQMAFGGQRSRVKRLHRVQSAKIDWSKTIAKNLKYYQPEHDILIPQQFYGSKRQSKKIKRIHLVVDQSASMAESMLFASLYAAVITKVSSVGLQFVVFDTEVVDLTEYLEDVVDLIMQTQLGGGTDIAKVLDFVYQQIEDAQQSIVILISDLFDGYDDQQVKAAFQRIKDKGSDCIVLLALQESGTAAYNQNMANELTQIGISSLFCSADQFPSLLAKAINQSKADYSQ